MAQWPIYGDKKPGPNCTGNYIVNRPDLKQNSSELSVFYLVLPELQKAKSERMRAQKIVSRLISPGARPNHVK